MRQTSSELRELFVRLTLPLLIGHLAIIGLSITDIILSGHVSREDLAGVMLGATLFDLPMMFVLGIFIANSTLVSRLHGRGDNPGLNHHFQNTLWLSLPVGLVMAGALYLVRSQLLPQLDASEQVRQVAADYLLPMTGTAFLLPMLIALRTSLEAIGHPRVAMAFNVAGFAANIPLDAALIYGWGPLPALGGVGCGWATLIIVAAIVIGLHLYIHCNETFAPLKVAGNLRPPARRTMAGILLLGAPMGGAILAEAGFFHMIPLMAAKLGTLALAAHAVAMSFDLTMFILPLALSQAITIRVAAALGRDDSDRARRIARLGLYSALAIGLIQCAVVTLCKQWIPAMYTDDGAVADTAVTLLAVAAVVRIFDAVHIAGSGVLRGHGRTTVIFAISTSAFWLAGMPLVWLASASGFGWAQSQIQAIWYAILVAVICACAMTLWQVRKTLATAQ